jgi:hypothetical protein
MSNYKSDTKRLLILMDGLSPIDDITAVLESDMLSKGLIDKWVMLISERSVRAILGRSGCPEWENWATQFLIGGSTEALASQASVKAMDAYRHYKLWPSQEGESNALELSKVRSSSLLAFAAHCIAEAIQMWHGGEMEDVPFNVRLSGGYEAVASIISANPFIDSWDSFFDAYCDLTVRGNWVLLRSVIRGALTEGDLNHEACNHE